MCLWVVMRACGVRGRTQKRTSKGYVDDVNAVSCRRLLDVRFASHM